jgi:hypothetical protein
MKPRRLLLGGLFFALLAAATGTVLVATRRMSLLMEAADRIEAGVSPADVLRDLDSRVDWAPLPEEEANRLAARLSARPPVRVWRGGPRALLVFPDGERALALRSGSGWTLMSTGTSPGVEALPIPLRR